MENIEINQQRIKKRERKDVTTSNPRKKNKIDGSLRRSQAKAALAAEAAYQAALAGAIHDSDSDSDSDTVVPLVELTDVSDESDSEESYEESQRQSGYSDSDEDECCGAAEEFIIPASQKG